MVTLLQAALDLLGQSLAVRQVVVLGHVRLVRVERVHRYARVAAKPPGQGLG